MNKRAVKKAVGSWVEVTWSDAEPEVALVIWVDDFGVSIYLPATKNHRAWVEPFQIKRIICPAKPPRL